MRLTSFVLLLFQVLWEKKIQVFLYLSSVVAWVVVTWLIVR